MPMNGIACFKHSKQYKEPQIYIDPLEKNWAYMTFNRISGSHGLHTR